MFEETFAEAWNLRYGTSPSVEYPDLARFLAHRSVRHFTDAPVPESLIAALIGTAQSASTSSNLQLFSVVSVQDPERRARITELCDNQDQVAKAPWFLAFCGDHHRARQMAERTGQGGDALDYFEFLLMAAVDAALAAERFVCAAEAVGLSVCYIGALRNHPQGVKELLQLPDGVFGVFGLCVGYPDPAHSAEIKPRLPQSAVWFRETYPENPDVSEYDARMSAFYASQNMRPDVTWSMRSARRTEERSLGGREVWLEWLREQGLGRR